MLYHPGRLIAIAIFLLLFGAVMPFLTIVGVFESTFFLNFLVFTASVGGLLLGIMGVAMYVGKERNKRKDEWKGF